MNTVPTTAGNFANHEQQIYFKFRELSLLRRLSIYPPPTKVPTHTLKMVQNLVQEMVQQIVQGFTGPVPILPYASYIKQLLTTLRIVNWVSTLQILILWA